MAGKAGGSITGLADLISAVGAAGTPVPVEEVEVDEPTQRKMDAVAKTWKRLKK